MSIKILKLFHNLLIYFILSKKSYDESFENTIKDAIKKIQTKKIRIKDEAFKSRFKIK